jgi:hypothetical protein
MERHGDRVNRPQPPYFIDGTSRLKDGCAGHPYKSISPSAGLYFVFDTSLEQHLQEMLRVLVSRNYAGRNPMSLDGNTRPPDLSTRQGGRGFDQWLGSPVAANFDAVQTRLRTRSLRPAPFRN